MTGVLVGEPASFANTLVKIDANADRPLGVSIPMNSVQINIVLLVDVEKALRTGKLDGSLYMMDNSVNSAGKPSDGRGTTTLQTICMQGMVLNWIVFSIAGPIFPAITDIEFLDRPVCAKLGVYGAATIDRSPNYIPGVTPVYHYWAGLVLPNVPGGRYRYRVDVALGATTLSVTTPSLDVAEIPQTLKLAAVTSSSKETETG